MIQIDLCITEVHLVIDLNKLNAKKVETLTTLQLRALCKELDIRNVGSLRRSELVSLILQTMPKYDSNTNSANSYSNDNIGHTNVKAFSTSDKNDNCDIIETPQNFDHSNDANLQDGFERGEIQAENTDDVYENCDNLPIIDIENSVIQKSDEGIEIKKQFNNGEGENNSESKNEQPTGRFYKNEKNKNTKYQKTYQNKKQSPEEIDLTECEIRSGILEISPDGFGFLRAKNFRNSEQDTYVSAQKIRKCGLRVGDYITAYTKVINELKPPAMVEPITVNDKPASEALNRPLFENFVPIYPKEKLKLEVGNKRNDLAVRAIDLIAPIGKGQRAMVVSPPKAGKTTLLKMIANSITENNPEVKLMVLLIDERPEEVTDMQRSINGEVIYSTFDEESDNHIRVAELVLARAKRIVESGQDVVILLDSLTRMARANNVIVPSSGKTLSGGVDPVALYFPKRFFGAARNIENGASLTIIATALVDTGSRMDDIVYEEFKGTGNMEIHLDRRLSEKRIFPAIDLLKSGTRREELLLTQKELEGVYNMRRLLSSGDPQEAAESIITIMMRTNNNDELIKCMGEQLAKLKKEGWRI